MPDEPLLPFQSDGEFFLVPAPHDDELHHAIYELSVLPIVPPHDHAYLLQQPLSWLCLEPVLLSCFLRRRR